MNNKISGGYFASPLRYPGGKGRLGPWLASVIEHNKLKGGCYVEPYAGGAGAALYLLLQRHVDRIVINDADRLIYAFWQSVVHESAAFVEKIRETPITMESRIHFQSMIATPEDHSILDVGFATFFLNRTSRSGILSGGVLGGKKQSSQIKLDARYNTNNLVDRVLAIGAMRDQITVLGIDALTLLQNHSCGFPQNTLIYLDPPYYVKGSQLYRNFYQHADHVEIANTVRQITQPVIITYDNAPEISKLYAGMASSKFSLHYSTHLNRPKTIELMIYANLKLPSPPKLTRKASLPQGQASTSQIPSSITTFA